jgi:hypothetical protein
MFIGFFYALRGRGIAVTPTAFLRLQRALSLGLVTSLSDFYTVARAILVKSERDFDLYDQVFTTCFADEEWPESSDLELQNDARALLEEWLKDPESLADALGLDPKQMARMSAEELEQYFFDRLQDQDGAHHQGRKWIGTGGISPVGHSGQHPSGMRVGGTSQRRSAVKVATERRYREYGREAPLRRADFGEALKRLRHLKPVGAWDQLSIPKTLHATMRNGGEIDILFERRLADRLKVILLIDNGGYSMDTYVEMVEHLFEEARSHFRQLEIFYFHNTIYKRVWRDPQRSSQPLLLEQLLAADPETRLIVVGDASMAPEELLTTGGKLQLRQLLDRPSIENFKDLAKAFRHAVWINPQSRSLWKYGQTIGLLGAIFPMFELTLCGLEKAVHHLAARH